jgi:hypothetical protein
MIKIVKQIYENLVEGNENQARDDLANQYRNATPAQRIQLRDLLLETNTVIIYQTMYINTIPLQ